MFAVYGCTRMSSTPEGLWEVPYAGIVATVTQCQLWGKPFLLVDKSGVVDKVCLDDKVLVVKVGLVEKIGWVDTVGLVDTVV